MATLENGKEIPRILEDLGNMCAENDSGMAFIEDEAGLEDLGYAGRDVEELEAFVSANPVFGEVVTFGTEGVLLTGWMLLPEVLLDFGGRTRPDTTVTGRDMSVMDRLHPVFADPMKYADEYVWAHRAAENAEYVEGLDSLIGRGAAFLVERVRINPLDGPFCTHKTYLVSDEAPSATWPSVKEMVECADLANGLDFFLSDDGGTLMAIAWGRAVGHGGEFLGLVEERFAIRCLDRTHARIAESVDPDVYMGAGGRDRLERDFSDPLCLRKMSDILALDGGIL